MSSKTKVQGVPDHFEWARQIRWYSKFEWQLVLAFL